MNTISPKEYNYQDMKTFLRKGNNPNLTDKQTLFSKVI